MEEMKTSKFETEQIEWRTQGVLQVHIQKTPKLFYNKYAYKADISLSGAGYYRSAGRFNSFSAFANYINSRGRMARFSDIDTKKLYSIFEATKKYGRQIRVRGEDNHLSICAETEELLFNIVKDSKLKGLVTNIFRPASEEAMQKLSEDVIFVGNPKFKFRAMIRSGRYKADTKKQILNYFKNYEESIIVTPGILYELNQNRDGYIQGYFHVDNTDVLLFLKLIHPKFVGKIFTLEAHETK